MRRSAVTERIRVFRHGRHSHRTPLAYPALAPLFAESIEEVRDPAHADLYLFAHVMDLEHAPAEMVRDWRIRRRPVVLLSEEPFWDTIWGKRPMVPQIVVDTGFGSLPVHQISHQTSDVFQFRRIPYYLLTNPRFGRAYRKMLARNAARRAGDWLRDWAARPLDVAFMFERRPEDRHNVQWPEGDLIGLCAWRTRLAESCHTGQVARLGRSWQGGRSRFELRNWHADKLRRLDGQARMIGALENTHQPDYITEKFFDAFACGALPLYVASTRHRIHDFGLPSESWLNLAGLSPEAGAARISGYLPDATVAAAFVSAQVRLAALFHDPETWRRETLGLRDRLLAALRRTL